jgi:hypothetical protein
VQADTCVCGGGGVMLFLVVVVCVSVCKHTGCGGTQWQKTGRGGGKHEWCCAYEVAHSLHAVLETGDEGNQLEQAALGGGGGGQPFSC